MSSLITCLLFDIDGTLFDTNEANVASYAAAFKELGLSFKPEVYRQFFGLRYAEMMKALIPEADDELLQRIKTAKVRHYKTNLGLVKPNTGLIDLATSATHNYRTALVTTASKPNIDALLKHFNIDPQSFEFIITGEDVQKGKPDPECYLSAIKRLGVQPSDCLVFEDSDHGVQAARAAGTHVVRVKL